MEGCCHGELDAIYADLAALPEPVDLLLVCGDFQAVRNWKDLQCMAVPEKYKRLGTFYKYVISLYCKHSWAKATFAPVPLYFTNASIMFVSSDSSNKLTQ